MSITRKRFSAAIFLAKILICALTAAAQDFEVKIEVASAANIRVEGKLYNEKLKQSERNWSFSQTFANEDNSGGRISDFHLTDRENLPVFVKQFAAGEYLAAAQAEGFSYRINLKPSPNIQAKAHASWIEDEQGIMMLDDLLPQFDSGGKFVSAKIKIALPPDWKIITNEKTSDGNAFYAKNYAKAMFAVGKKWREQKAENLNLAISGEWQFTDAEAAENAENIFEMYRKIFGEMPPEKTQIFLARFPREIKFGRWEAEARGANLTIFSSGMPFKALSVQRLHEQLRHELFHLWIPNNLALTGNYDWFYEGFTVYQALRSGVAMNQIRFEDFLATLAEAYDLDAFQSQRKSLLESSVNPWSGANRQVYARGMLTAFLCDTTLLRRSRGSRSVNDIFQQLYRKHRFPNKPENGSEAVLGVLKNYSELDYTVENYIKGAGKIDWAKDLENLGIETKQENTRLKLSVKANLNGKQKDLLNELGYNNWRKSSEKSK